jgi:hypothetical protein
LARYLTTLGIHISTLDDGADTCVMGDGWKIMETTDPQRYANLVGYDENSTRKRHLKIITANSLATTDNDERIILCVHEAVNNPGSKTTLLSEFQMRENGIVVDSVAKTHKKDADGTFGTQSITIDEHTTIPLIVSGDLMTFQFQEPNEADYETCRIVELTKNERLSPQDHYDDVRDNMRHVQTIASSTRISTNDDHLVEEDFPFYDATDDDDHSYWYSSDTFACRVNRTVVDEE